jgi:hypothetical protein
MDVHSGTMRHDGRIRANGRNSLLGAATVSGPTILLRLSTAVEGRVGAVPRGAGTMVSLPPSVLLMLLSVARAPGPAVQAIPVRFHNS